MKQKFTFRPSGDSNTIQKAFVENCFLRIKLSVNGGTAVTYNTSRGWRLGNAYINFNSFCNSNNITTDFSKSFPLPPENSGNFCAYLGSDTQTISIQYVELVTENNFTMPYDIQIGEDVNFRLESFEIVGGFIQQNDVCNKITGRFQTNMPIKKITGDIDVNNINLSDYYAELTRGNTYNVVLESADGQTIQKSFTATKELLESEFKIDVYTNANGNSIIITNNSGLEVWYALGNGLTPWIYQTNGVFTNVAFGSLMISFSDKYGCNFIKNITITKFEINSITFEEYTTGNACESVLVYLKTSENIKRIDSQYFKIIENLNQKEYKFSVLRERAYELTIESTSGQKIFYVLNTPEILTEEKIRVNVNSGPENATVVVQNNTLLNLRYSLNQSAFQTKNSFDGVAYGPYILTVKDDFGCTKEFPFVVASSFLKEPYFYISKANSLRFANRINWGDAENYKNDENTLSCEVDVDLPYKETQLFQSADVITTQFKSNYSTNTAMVVKEDGSVINIPIEKKTNNIGVKEKKDARLFPIGSGKSGVYFHAGNNYDYETNVITGQHALNGLLPEWAQIGNYITINTAWYLIEGIFFDETKNAYIIVFESNFSGTETNVVCGSIYNRFNYEVYEFNVDFKNYIDEILRVKITCTDPKFTTINYLSEELHCNVRHEKTLEIKYKNKTNTDIYYSTGIEHKIRIPYLKIIGKADENSEIHKTDTDTILLNADLYEVDEFQFEPVTKEIWRKLIIALSHEIVKINGVGYVKNGSFNTEGPLGESNLYILTATMIKTGNVYNSQTTGTNDFNSTSTEVPGLLSSENGYFKY